MCKTTCNGSTTWEWWMPEELDLRGSDLMAYALVWCFSKDGKGEFSASWSQFAKRMGIVTETAGLVIARLLRRGLIERRCVMTPRGKSYKYWVTQQYTEHFPRIPGGRAHADEALVSIPRSRKSPREDTLYPHRKLVMNPETLYDTADETIQDPVVTPSENRVFPGERNTTVIEGETIRTSILNNNDKAKSALSSVVIEEQTQPNSTKGGTRRQVKEGHQGKGRSKAKAKSKSKTHRTPQGPKRTKRSMRRDRAIALRDECGAYELRNVDDAGCGMLFSEGERRWACGSDGRPGSTPRGRGDRFLYNREAEMAFCRPTFDALVGACDGDVSVAKACLARMDFSGNKPMSYVIKDAVENEELLPRLVEMARGHGVCACAVIPDPKW